MWKKRKEKTSLIYNPTTIDKDFETDSFFLFYPCLLCSPCVYVCIDHHLLSTMMTMMMMKIVYYYYYYWSSKSSGFESSVVLSDDESCWNLFIFFIYFSYTMMNPDAWMNMIFFCLFLSYTNTISVQRMWPKKKNSDHKNGMSKKNNILCWIAFFYFIFLFHCYISLKLIDIFSFIHSYYLAS